MIDSHDILVGVIWSMLGMVIGACWGFVLGTFTERAMNSTIKKWLNGKLASRGMHP